jgi:hypothetical protein
LLLSRTAVGYGQRIEKKTDMAVGSMKKGSLDMLIDIHTN